MSNPHNSYPIYIKTFGSAWGGAKVHLCADAHSVTPKCSKNSIYGEPVSAWPVDPFSASGAEPMQACKKCFPQGRPDS